MLKRIAALIMVGVILLVSTKDINLVQAADGSTVLYEPLDVPRSFETIALYTAGSNQEWALQQLLQMENSEEAVRLYEFLMRAHTYLMRYDARDYMDEYYFVKNIWLDAMPDFDEESQTRLQKMIDGETWSIDISYPVERPFRLSFDEVIAVCSYFRKANPQFFLNIYLPAVLTTNHGQIPIITIPAYYAFAERRQEVYQNITNAFDSFKEQMAQNIDMYNQVEILEYVFAHVNETLTYNHSPEAYLSRIQSEALATIVGFFGDYNVSWFTGYAATFMYLLNRLGIPTTNHSFATYVYNEHGERINPVGPIWNIAETDSGWYFIDSFGVGPLDKIFQPS